jgi:hypothetical protein
MSFDRDFFNMLPETVTYYPYSSMSTDGYGSRAYGDARSVKARIQAVREDARTVSSREVAGATFKLLMAPWSTSGTSDTVMVSVLDKLVLPSAFIVSGSSSPPIVKAYPVQDEDGLHHNEVWL